jgi:hypothetical protein
MALIETRSVPTNDATTVVTEDGQPVLYFHEGDRGWTWESARYGAGDVYATRNEMLSAARHHLTGIGCGDLSDVVFDMQYPRRERAHR